MYEEYHHNFFTTSDNIKISYYTNFCPKELQEEDLVIIFSYGLICNINHYKYQIETLTI